ncbi:YcjX family protein [Microbulbifer salipaludis]|uniref:YcjX family protein n=1 Tax=Microbulbifer salipaludis TaxID=187980 RepID=A0ABS3E9E1_9GAMM|nr:YcjX family protein [Microbulbifer salipaludis]MBN8431931.1 YcjX family protein [Microbulbifer salipaludis]
MSASDDEGQQDTRVKSEGRLRSLRRHWKQFRNEARDKSHWAAERLLDKRICIGITGLSGAGKSTLITSLIYQLSHPDQAQLPGFAPALNGRLLGAELHPALDTGLPLFEYPRCLEALTANPPRWPESTRDLSALELHVHLRGRRLGRDYRQKLILELRDYPGEWLMDLPLLQMDFATWCRHQRDLLDGASRADLAPGLLGELRGIAPEAVIEAGRLDSLWQNYRQFLRDCRSERKLSYLQPGRALLDNDEYGFFPLPALHHQTEQELRALPDDSVYKVLEARYRAYVEKKVAPFVETHFRHLDRQLVLVDLISTLFAGEEALEDMRKAFGHIADTFRYGSSGLLRKLWRPRIDRLIFAATKVDQVLAADHDALRQLLGQQLQQVFSGARHRGLPLYCEAIAAVRCSNESVRDGRRMLVGHGMDGRYLGFENAEIMGHLPQDQEWQHYTGGLPPQLRPPAGIGREGYLPHIRMDALLNLLLGDKV